MRVDLEIVEVEVLRKWLDDNFSEFELPKEKSFFEFGNEGAKLSVYMMFEIWLSGKLSKKNILNTLNPPMKSDVCRLLSSIHHLCDLAQKNNFPHLVIPIDRCLLLSSRVSASRVYSSTLSRVEGKLTANEAGFLILLDVDLNNPN